MVVYAYYLSQFYASLDHTLPYFKKNEKEIFAFICFKYNFCGLPPKKRFWIFREIGYFKETEIFMFDFIKTVGLFKLFMFLR